MLRLLGRKDTVCDRPLREIVISPILSPLIIWKAFLLVECIFLTLTPGLTAHIPSPEPACITVTAASLSPVTSGPFAAQ